MATHSEYSSADSAESKGRDDSYLRTNQTGYIGGSPGGRSSAMTLGEYAELYGEEVDAAPTRPTAGRPHSKPIPLGEFDAPCDSDGGCQYKGTCVKYALGCQVFYQWVEGTRLPPKRRAAHPVQIPCRDMYLKVFTTERTEQLPVPPLQYIINEEETVALNSLARQQRKVS